MAASGSFSWSWNSFLGDGFVGAYSFYTVFNPFAWLIALFPDGLILQGAMLVTLLKLAVSMMGAMLYIRRFCRKDSSALLGALLYTFSGFTLVNTSFYFFLDVVAVFPFLLYGLERLIGEGKRRVYVISLLLNAVINYYFFVSTVILVVIYVVFRLELYQRSAWKEQWKTLCRIAGYSILGTGLAGAALIPSIYAIFGSGKATESVGTGMELLYWAQKVLEHLRTLVAPIESGRYHAFYDSSIWSSTGVYLPVFGCFFVAQWCLRKKDWLKKLCIVLTVCYFVPVLNGMFNLFSSTAYTRWLYGMALVFSLTTAMTVEEVAEGKQAVNKKLLIAVTLFAAGLLLAPTGIYVLHELGISLLSRFASVCVTEYFMGYAALGVMLILTAMNYGALWFTVGVRKHAMKTTIFVVAAVCALNFGVYNEINCDLNDTGYNNQYYYGNTMVDGTEKEAQPFVYRVDYPGQITNYGLFKNMPAVNYYNSLQNPGSSAFALAVGIGDSLKDTILRTPVVGGEYTDALLSVKYYYDYDGDSVLPVGFRYWKSENGVDIYENENYIPMGFVYDSYCVEEQLTELEPWERAAIMLNTLVVTKSQEEFVSKLLPLVSELAVPSDVREAVAKRNETVCSYFAGDSTGFTAEIRLEKENIVFFSVPNDSGWDITVNGKSARTLDVNFGLLGIYCDTGNNVISATYHTKGLTLGLTCSLVCLAVWLLMEILNKRGRREDPVSERRYYGKKIHQGE